MYKSITALGTPISYIYNNRIFYMFAAWYAFFVLLLFLFLAFNNIILFVFIFIPSKKVQIEWSSDHLLAYSITLNGQSSALPFNRVCPSKSSNAQFTHANNKNNNCSCKILFANRKWKIHKYFIASLLSCNDYANAHAVHTAHVHTKSIWILTRLSISKDR